MCQTATVTGAEPAADASAVGNDATTAAPPTRRSRIAPFRTATSSRVHPMERRPAHDHSYIGVRSGHGGHTSRVPPSQLLVGRGVGVDPEAGAVGEWPGRLAGRATEQ